MTSTVWPANSPTAWTAPCSPPAPWRAPGARPRCPRSASTSAPTSSTSRSSSATAACTSEPRDHLFLQQVFERLDRGPDAPPFGAGEVLALLAREPQLMQLNTDIVRNAGYLKSLAEDAQAVRPAA
ncbi:MAG: hypothetical protein RL223_1677 [Pseudomonadota bacterium]